MRKKVFTTKHLTTIDNRNTTDKKLNFCDIHELLRQANETPAPSWQVSTEEPKPKKVRFMACWVSFQGW